MTTTAAYFVGLSEAPSRFFGGEGVYVLAPTRISGEPEPIPRSDVDLLMTLKGEIVSPEALAPTSLRGAPILVRCADPARFVAIEGASLVAGRLPNASLEAMAGARLAARLGIEVGDEVPLAGAFVGRVGVYRVVGIFTSVTPTVDEIVVPFEDVPRFTTFEPGDAGIVRIRTLDPTRLEHLLSATAPEVLVSDFRVEPQSVVPHETAHARARLTNWGKIAAEYPFRVKAGNDTLTDVRVTIPARTSIEVAIPFLVPQPGRYDIQVNPTDVLEVRPPELEARDFSPTAYLGASHSFRIVDGEGRPAVGALARAGGVNSTLADGEGRVTLPELAAGRHHVLLLRDGTVHERGVVTLDVLDPRYQFSAHFVVRSLSLSTSVAELNSTVFVEITAQNEGGLEGESTLTVLVDGEPRLFPFVRGRPGETVALSYPIGRLDPGVHRISIDGHSRELKIWDSYDPVTARILGIEGPDVVAVSGESSAESGPPPVQTSSLSSQAYVASLFGPLSEAMLALGFATSAIAALGAAAAIIRHVRERAPTIGVLKALGASDEWVLARAMREGLVAVAFATIAGLVLGTFVFLAIDSAGVVRAMGHVLEPRLPVVGYATVFFASLAVGTAILQFAVKAELAQGADRLIRGGEEASTASLETLPELEARLS